MNIKLSAESICIACSRYFKERDAAEIDKFCTSGCEEIMGRNMSLNKNNKFFETIWKVSMYADNTSYRYVIIDEKEYLKLERYL